MNRPESCKVVNFGQDKIDAVARATGVLVETNISQAPSALAEKGAQNERYTSSAHRVAAGLGLLAASALLLLPRPDQAPAPAQDESYAAKAETSAQIPYDPAADMLAVEGIQIKLNNHKTDTPSEAILGNPNVKDYLAKHPKESSSVTTSAMTVPTNRSGEYVLVSRDIDNDGDNDAIAVSRQ